MKRNCVLCYNRECMIPKENAFFHIAPQVISSCNKYLAYDIVQTVAWTGVFDSGFIFCQPCFENIEKLSRLNVQLEQLQYEVNQFAALLNQEIFKERRTYELNNQNPNNIANTYSTVATGNFSYSTSVSTSATLSSPAVTYNTSKEFTNQHILQSVPPPPNYVDSVATDDNDDDPWASEDLGPGENGEKSELNDISVNSELQKDGPPRAITSTDLQPFLEKGSAGFQCKKCFKKFGRLSILQRHDCDKVTYNCDTCGLAFSSQGVLKLHVSRTHSGVKPFKCETCGKGFGFKHHLVIHIRSHTGEKPFECDLCDKRFSDSTCYYNHKRKHESNVRYNCDICNKSYATVKSLQYHVKVHLGTSNYNCDTCGRAFASRKTLTNHQLTHTGEKTHVCDQCGRAFSRISSLETHMLRHRGEKPIKCTMCDKRFRSNPHLRQHTIIVHQKPETFICEVCGKTCTNSVQYKHHLRVHRETTKECPTCSKKFKYKHSLEMHIKTEHDGERPSKCDLCTKTFKNAAQLKRHKKRNCEDAAKRPTIFNRCEVCKKYYKGEGELLKHQVLSHSVTAGSSVICEKCDGEFVDLGGYQWHLLKLHGTGRLRCKKCKNRRTMFTTSCDFFCHSNTVHNGKGNPYKCKHCLLTMATKDLHGHECSQSHSKIEVKKEVKRTRRILPRKCNSNSVSFRRKRVKRESSSEGSDEGETLDTVIKQEFEEMSDEYDDESQVKVKLEPESEGDSEN